MNVSKLLTENSDAVFKINQPGKEQFFELQNEVKNMGLKNKGYFVAGLDKEEFGEFIQKEMYNSNNIVFLFTESYSSEKNIEEVKDAVAMVKHAGMQAVVVLNTKNNKPGVPHSEISYYSSKEELFDGLESMFEVKLSSKDEVSRNIDNIMSKGVLNAEGSKPKHR